VGLGAIVVVGEQQKSSDGSPWGQALFPEPLAYLDVLGRSTAERMIERFARAETDVISVFQRTDGNKSEPLEPAFGAFENVEFQLVHDPSSAVSRKLEEYGRSGIQHSFLLFGNVYAETDLLDLFYFHREARRGATRAMNQDGLLDFWVVDCRKVQDTNLEVLLTQLKERGNFYFIREYTNRLTHPRDLRRFASDLLQGRCVGRPAGREVRRGIWIDDGAEVHRRARMVAPAYIGRNSKIMEDALITRTSNIERDCFVDYGTVIEDSSILEGTGIGICLDVCRAIASGNRFFSVDREVVIEIADPSVMRSNGLPVKQAKERKWVKNFWNFGRQRRQTVADLQLAPSAPDECMLETNPLQG
jgi:carbonic anhydrase/acetyltransferase-like protein (isoleucine patch superfamily)